jgi:CheY-like chemotaxis protein
MINILLLDDDTNSRKKLSDYLRSVGYQAFAVKGKLRALERIATNQVHIILVNAHFLDLSTLEMCTHMVEEGEKFSRKIPIVLLYNPRKNSVGDHIQFKEFGIEHVVKKPFHVEDLRLLLSDNIQMKSAEKPRSQASAETITKSVTQKLPLSGLIREQSFPELLWIIFLNQYTLTLTIYREEEWKVIYFKQGKIVNIQSSFLEEESLGHILVLQGIITQAQHEMLKTRMEQMNCRQGEALIEMGIISSHDIYQALTYQAEFKILNLFRWPEGNYHVEPLNPETQFPPFFADFNIVSLIRKGIDNYFPIEKLKDLLARYYKAKMRINPDRSQDIASFNLNRQEKILIASINERNKIADLPTLSQLPMEHIVKIIYALYVIEAVYFNDEGGRKRIFDLKEFESGLPPKIETPRLGITKEVAFAAEAEDFRKLQRSLEEEQIRQNLGQTDPIKRPSAEIGRHTREILKDEFANLMEREYHQQDIKAVSTRISTKSTTKIIPSLGNNIADELKSELSFLINDPPKKISSIYDEPVAAPKKKEEEKKPKAGEAVSLLGLPNELDDIKIIKAELEFENGQRFLTEKKYDQAAKCFKKAHDLLPGEVEFQSYFAWALYNMDGDNKQAAHNILHKVIDQNTGSSSALLFMGKIFTVENKLNDALAMFNQILELNPLSQEAKDEIHKIQQKQASQGDSEGLSDELPVSLKW